MHYFLSQTEVRSSSYDLFCVRVFVRIFVRMFVRKLCCTRIVKRACTRMHDMRSVKTYCFSGKHIVSFDDTLSLWRIHCLSGRHIVSCVSTMIVVRRSPVARSLGRSFVRSLARSIDHSLARSLARLIARSLTDMCSLQSQYKGAAFGRHHKGGRPSAAPLDFHGKTNF